MRCLFASSTLFCLLGCGGFSDAMQAEQQHSEEVEEIAEKKIERANVIAERKQARREAANLPNDGKGIIGKFTQEVVDKKKVMAENSDLVEVDLKNLGGGYLTSVTTAAVNVPARYATLVMDHWVKIFEVQHERFPTLEEYVATIKKENVKLVMLPLHRMYAYDEETGTLVVLEDTSIAP